MFHHCLNFDRQTEQVDEARAVLLVLDVVLGEGRDVLVIERIGRGDAGVDDVALVQLEFDVTGDRLLRAVDERGQRLAQRSEPLSVVDEVGELDGVVML